MLERTTVTIRPKLTYDRAPVPARYGCHNRAPFAASHVGQDGYSDVVRDGYGQPVRSPAHVDIPHRMTTECQYVPPAGQADPKCDGCNHRRTS